MEQSDFASLLVPIIWSSDVFEIVKDIHNRRDF